MLSMPLFTLLPVEFLPLIIVGGGIMLVIGARTIANSLFVLAAIMAFLPPFMVSVLALLPEWLLWLLIIFVWLSIFGSISAFFLGKGAADQMIGSLAADAVKWVLCLPFRLARWLFNNRQI